MKLRTRFAEYALTGGFMIIVQAAVVLVVFGGDVKSKLIEFGTALNTIIESFPVAIQPVAISLAAALAFISVFFVGLLLDLLGSYFVI